MFKEYALKDIIDGKPRQGIMAPSRDYADGDLRYIRITDIDNHGRLIPDNYRSVDSATKDMTRFLLHENDIVFSRTGSNIHKTYFYEKEDGDLIYGSFLIRCTIDEKKVNPRYIKYYCLSDLFKTTMERYSTGAGGNTRRNISISQIKYLTIKIPSKPEQDRLIGILDSLNEKICLNEKITKELQKEAEYLFSELQHSGLKQDEDYLGNLVELATGRSEYSEKGKYPVYGSGGILGKNEIPVCTNEALIIPRKGSLNKLKYVSQPFSVAETVYYTKAVKKGYIIKYLWHYLKDYDFTKLDSGVGIPSINKKQINSIKIKIFDDNVLKDFEQKVAPIYDLMENYKMENEKLEYQIKNIINNFLDGKIRITA